MAMADPQHDDDQPSTGHLRGSRRAAARHYVLVRHRENWLLLTKFSVVGGSGVVVNLGVYLLALDALGQTHFRPAAVIAFVVANTTNYLLNKYWTFQRPESADVALEYSRFLVVGIVGLILNLVILTALVDGVHLHKVGAQVIAIGLVTPISFVGNKLWTFGVRTAR